MMTTSRTDESAKTFDFGSGALVQGILCDTSMHTSILKVDVFRFSTELLTSKVKNESILKIVFSSEATRSAIKEACNKTALLHMIARDNELRTAISFAEEGVDYSASVVANDIVELILAKGGELDQSVREAFELRFDPATYDKCSLTTLCKFFFEQLGISTDVFGHIDIQL